MGVIINPRGTSGAGKTELVRRIMALYRTRTGSDVAPVYREGRERPICYRLRHPLGGRPLAVLGHYEVTSGGCDTIGGVDEAFWLASQHAARGHDVLFEGLAISREVDRSAALAEVHGLHILHLGTPLEECIRNVVRRRRARRDTRPLISKIVAAEHEKVADACRRLRSCAAVEAVSFDQALLRAQELLGFGRHDLVAPCPALIRGERRSAC
ncbi:MAG TPA: hypothetical protein VHG30_06085 [Microvirga sp.]|nr:hypothetical protein [Microvirga sp.]